MLLVTYNWCKKWDYDCIKFERKKLLDKRLTSVYVILPFVPADGHQSNNYGQILLNCNNLIPLNLKPPLVDEINVNFNI